MRRGCMGLCAAALAGLGCVGDMGPGTGGEPGLLRAVPSRGFGLSPTAGGECAAMLAAAGVGFAPGPAMRGVAMPVTVTPPIRGIRYRYLGNTAPRASFAMDCQLALALVGAAEVLAAHGIVEVADLGVYNYRCIDQSVSPPDCPGSTLSMHAFALAVDFAGLTTQDGTFYSVRDDWVIDPAGQSTCSAPTENAKDAFLHQVLCDLHAHQVFHIYLTPNYNAAHRDHFHLDLTPGADFLQVRAGSGIDQGPADD